MGAVEISGLNELIYKINDCKNLTKIKEVVRANGAEMNDKMKGIAKKGVAFKKGYSKGGLGGSINTTISEKIPGNSILQGVTLFPMDNSIFPSVSVSFTLIPSPDSYVPAALLRIAESHSFTTFSS